jgi:hypothetical protein
MSHRVACVAFALTVVVLQPQPVAAQDSNLSEILVRLIQARVELAGPPPGSPFPSHAAHFVPGEDQQLAPYHFNQAIVSQLSTFPLGSAAGGFSYSYNPELGIYTRRSTSFGPSFAERAVTIGRSRWSIGANYQHARFRSFEGRRLDNGDVRFYLPHVQESGAFFEGDVVEAALSMRLTTNTFAVFGNYGLTDRLDIGVAVPIVHVSLDATVDATILRLATGDAGPTAGIHTFPGGATSASFSSSGSASGVGDVLVRAKYQLLQRRGGGLAAAVDVRTPTGDERNLLGTGATQAKILLVGSSATGRFSPHFNIGYTVSGDSSNPFIRATDDINYAVGTEFTPTPRVTLAVDLLGRQMRDAGRLVEQPKVFNWTTQGGTSGSTTFSEFALASGNVNQSLTAIGAKYNPLDNLLLSVNVLLPLTDRGIRSRPVPVVGFDYTF